MQIATDAVASWSRDAAGSRRAFPARRRRAFEVLAQGHRSARRVAGKAEAQSRAGARRRDDPARRAARAAKRSCGRHAERGLRGADQGSDRIRARRAARLRGGQARARADADARAGRGAKREDAARQGRHRDRSGDFLRATSSRIPATGTHLCHAMLLPKPESRRAPAGACRRKARSISAPRRSSGTGKATTVLLRNPRYLNAEDETTLHQVETAVDLAILDPASEIARAARRRRSTIRNTPASACSAPASISRTSITARSPYLWYVTREMGFVNKMMRGLARPRREPGRDLRRHDREAVGRGRRGASRSAAAASICSRWTTWWRRATPT